MSNQPSSLLHLDKECLDSIESDTNQLIPWFVISMCALQENSDELLSEYFLVRLRRKIKAQWDTLEHPMKECLSFDRLTNRVEVITVPLKFKLIYSTLKDIQRGLQPMQKPLY